MARHTGNAPTASLKVACVQIRASTGCVRAPLDAVPLRKCNGTSRRGRPWRLFACVMPASLLTLQPPDNFAIGKARQVNARRGHRERRSALFAYPPVVIGDTAKPVMIERSFDVQDGPERFEIFLASRTHGCGSDPGASERSARSASERSPARIARSPALAHPSYRSASGAVNTHASSMSVAARKARAQASIEPAWAQIRSSGSINWRLIFASNGHMSGR